MTARISATMTAARAAAFAAATRTTVSHTAGAMPATFSA